MRPAASCSVPRVASVTERTSDRHIYTFPAPPVSQSTPWKWAGRLGCTPNQNGLGQAWLLFTRLTLPLCLPHFGQLVGSLLLSWPGSASWVPIAKLF